MKKSIAFFAALALLLTCACGRAENAETTEPATAPPTTAAPTTAAPTTQAPEPETETVISYDFNLEALPEIGEHQRKTADCFYDEPLREFKTSDRYGTLLPYRLTDVPAGYDSLGKQGFITVDGKIVTDCIYHYISRWDLGDKTVFYATGRVIDESPESIPDWDEDPDGAMAAFQRAEDYYNDHLLQQLISADGKKCLTLYGEMSYFTDPDTGVSLIYCAQYREESEYFPLGCESFLVYDTDLNLIADLSSDLQEYGHLWINAADKDSFVLEAGNYEDPENGGSFFLLYYEDCELDHILDMGSESPFSAVGDLVICHERIYNKDGRTVYTFGETAYRTQYDPRNQCLYVYRPEQGDLTKLDRRGNVIEVVKTGSSSGNISLLLCESGAETYVVIRRDNLTDGASENADDYVVYDADLRQVCVIDGTKAKNTCFCDNSKDDAPSVFLVARNEQTDVLDISGNTVFTIPFAYDDLDFNSQFGDGSLIFLRGENNERAVYSPRDNTVVTVSSKITLNYNPMYFSKKLLVFSENIKGDDEYEWRNVIQDLTTGKRLMDNITQIDGLTIDGNDYFSIIKNEILYLCDEDLNVIASLYDDLNV